MWVNMKPYSNIMHSSVATPYAIGVSRAQTLFDQKRNLIPIKPGHEISIKVIPKIVTTTLEFDQEDVDIRKCKGSHETEGFYFLRQGDNSKRSAMRTKSYCYVRVLYMSSGFWRLPVESLDFSQAENERTACKAEQIHKMTIIFTQT